jgi:hypothetical protein
MTAPARITQADIGRAMREAMKHKAKRVRVDLTVGTIDIVLEDNQIERLPDRQPPAGGPLKMQDQLDEKLVF